MADTSKHMKGRITWRADFAPDLWSIRIAPEQPLSFKPGQYATLGVMQDGARPLERPYSIVSSPVEPEMEFFFELVPEGELTPKLHKLGVGQEVLMRRACKGLFQLDRKSGHSKHFMLSTVTGVAPYVSMVRTLARSPEPGLEITVLQVGSRSWELGYREELEKLAQEHSWLRFIPSVSRFWEDPNWRGERGRAEDLVRKYADQFGMTSENTTPYLCGHPNMIENAKGILLRAGWPKEGIKEEIYWVPQGI